MPKKLFAAALLLALCFNHSFAEKVKTVKFGKITPEEIEMKVYDRDTTAEAVVLYQHAEFNPINGNYRYH